MVGYKLPRNQIPNLCELFTEELFSAVIVKRCYVPAPCLSEGLWASGHCDARQTVWRLQLHSAKDRWLKWRSSRAEQGNI